MKKDKSIKFIHNFITCGTIGWAIELLCSSVNSLRTHKDKRMIGQTSLIMFPIYGSAAILSPLSKKLCSAPVVMRGCIYASLIFLGEYVSGLFLKKYNCCPWDYSENKYNVKGVIRLDFAPAWFLLGLVFERCLCRSEK